jgi:hypothetical protein
MPYARARCEDIVRVSGLYSLAIPPGLAGMDFALSFSVRGRPIFIM